MLMISMNQSVVTHGLSVSLYEVHINLGAITFAVGLAYLQTKTFQLGSSTIPKLTPP